VTARLRAPFNAHIGACLSIALELHLNTAELAAEAASA